MRISPTLSSTVLLLAALSILSACDSSGPVAAGPGRVWIDASFELVSVEGTRVPGVVQTFESSTWTVEESRLELLATGEATLYRHSTTTHGLPEDGIVDEYVHEWSGPYAIEGDRIWLGHPATECDDIAQCVFAEEGTFADDVIVLVPSAWGHKPFRYERVD